MRDEDGEEIQVEVGKIGELVLSETAALDRAAIDMQVSTAKKYPRSITKSLQEAQELATLDEETAKTMFYTLPKRAGQDKSIEGPSARLAEIMMYSWGNIRAQAEVVDEGRTHITAVGTCFDLEKNVAVRVQVKRRITKSNGKRFGDDMIGVTGNAAISIALRNAVFKTIPATFVRKIYQASRQASIGKGTIDSQRQRAMEWFNKAGIKPEQVYALLEIGGWDDLGVEEIITLAGIVNAIKEGETTLEQVFNPPKSTEGASSLDAALEAAAKAKAEVSPAAYAAGTSGHQPLVSTTDPANPPIGGSGVPTARSGVPAPEPEKPKKRKPETQKEPATEGDGLVTEAYAKASRKATALAKAGALTLDAAEKLDAARDAGELDNLIQWDAEFTRLAKIHGVTLP